MAGGPFYEVQVPVMPIRAEARDASEMVTQGLAGEKVERLEAGEKDWVRVRCLWDGYEGWCDEKQLGPHADHELHGSFRICESLSCWERNGDGAKCWFSMGSNFRVRTDLDGYFLGNQLFQRVDSASGDLDAPVDPVAAAERLLGVPYLWGGRSAFGIDCSGLVQLAFGVTGIQLPRDASQQVATGQEVALGEARRGDLAFFANDKGAIIHVGILLTKTDILHAAGEVRRDKLSPQGIIHATTGKQTHSLAAIRRPQERKT